VLSVIRPFLLATALAALAALAPSPASPASPWAGGPTAAQREPPAPPPRPEELHPVLRVVDGDTLHVRRAGRTAKLRLCSVDTEEKLDSGGSRWKPGTVFGEETALWARAHFETHAQVDGQPMVALRFPGGEERLDAFGRLLCHVLLPDGTDFNLLLVREGRSPYFNKYGNSLVCHDAFVAAQERARELELGIWNPATNRARSPGAPSAKRPYDELLPWWQARAEAIDGFRLAAARAGRHTFDSGDPAALAAALEHCLKGGHPLRAFGAVERVYVERNGDRTVRLRGPTSHESLRIVIPRDAWPSFRSLELEARAGEALRQNHVYVTGRIEEGTRGPTMLAGSTDAWRIAGPEPEPR